MNISAVINNPKSETFFSFVIGLGLTIMLFHRPIQIQKVLSLDTALLEGKVVKANGKCYTYRVEDAMCEITSSK